MKARRNQETRVIMSIRDDLTHFGAVVVGSSPLMLIQAIHCARQGQSVCVIDCIATPGGMWRTAEVAGEQDVEISCHLIEAFPGVYAFLERLTGVSFAVLDPPPQRISARGYAIRYSSRMSVLAAVAMAHVRLVLLWAKSLRAPLGEDDEALHHYTRLRLLDFYRYLMPIIICGPHVQAPVTGFSHLIERLVEVCRESGVVFLKDRVVDIIRPDETMSWQVLCAEGTKLQADVVHASTSCGLLQQNQNHFVTQNLEDRPSLHVLAEVAKPHVYQDCTYAVFPHDPHVMRISRIDRKTPRPQGLLYLVQFWKDDPSIAPKKHTLVRQKLEHAKIIAPGDPFRLIGDVRSAFAPYVREIQMPEGEITSGFFVYSSAGNLASGIANWRQGRYRLRFGHFHSPKQEF